MRTRRARRGAAAPASQRGKLLAGAVLLALVLPAVVRSLVLEPFGVPTASMAPTVQAGEHVLANKLAYRLSPPRRGELAVLERPGSGEILLKRIVAVGGDRVAIEDGVLLVNGRPRHERYVNERLVDSVYFGPVRVPRGSVFVLGDNRFDSRDSRSFGPVPDDDLIGRVMLRIWPLERIGPL